MRAEEISRGESRARRRHTIIFVVPSNFILPSYLRRFGKRDGGKRKKTPRRASTRGARGGARRRRRRTDGFCGGRGTVSFRSPSHSFLGSSPMISLWPSCPPSGQGRRSRSTGKEEEKAGARGSARKLGQHFRRAVPSGAGGVLAQFHGARSSWKMLRAQGGLT